MVELDKSQKKIARTLISRALERECCTFLAKLKRLLQDEKAQSCHEKYLEIYKSIQTFDKDISRQYDGLVTDYLCYHPNTVDSSILM